MKRMFIFYTAIKEGGESETLNGKHNANPRSPTRNEVAINIQSNPTQSKILSSIIEGHGNEDKLVSTNFMHDEI